MRYLRELLVDDAGARDASSCSASTPSACIISRQLLHAEEGWLSATSENMALNVDMTAKKTAPFPDHRRAACADEGRARPAADARRRRPAHRDAGKGGNCRHDRFAVAVRSVAIAESAESRSAVPPGIGEPRKSRIKCHLRGMRISTQAPWLTAFKPALNPAPPATRTGRHRRAAASPRARGRGGRRSLSRRAQSGAAAGGRDARRPGAGAGRRRHRQDPRAHRAHRPHPRHRPRPAGRNPRRHLHQQGGARDEAPRRRDRRPGGRGHAVARHLPFDRREDPAPPCRAGRAENRFHHSRCRRPDPAAEAAARSREHRREALAGARAGDADRRLEEPRAHAGAGAARRGRACSPTARG